MRHGQRLRTRRRLTRRRRFTGHIVTRRPCTSRHQSRHRPPNGRTSLMAEGPRIRVPLRSRLTNGNPNRNQTLPQHRRHSTRRRTNRHPTRRQVRRIVNILGISRFTIPNAIRDHHHRGRGHHISRRHRHRQTSNISTHRFRNILLTHRILTSRPYLRGQNIRVRIIQRRHNTGSTSHSMRQHNVTSHHGQQHRALNSI